MAKKKEHTIISATTGEQIKPGEVPVQQAQTTHTVQQAAPVGNAKTLRIVACVLWALAIVFEVLAVLVAFGKINLTFLPQLPLLIVLIVLDLACVIVGSQLWKKANHIDPASKQNPTKFWLWNNMGVIVAVFAFVPLIILMLANKDLDKKTKAICTVVAIIALLIGGLTGYDFNPISSEEKEAAVEALADANIDQVFWAPFGKVYHTHEDCQALNQSETLTAGSVEQAIAAGRTRLCYFCAERDNIEGVTTDEAA